MDYAIARSFELRRMSYENQIALRIAEKNKGRAFYPSEIQDIFKLPPLKTVYLIPELDAPQASHAQRIRNEFYQDKLYPAFEHLSPLDLERVHGFDLALENSKVDFVYSGAATKRIKFRDQLLED